MIPARLRCAHLDNPLGVAPDRVRFSWESRCPQAAFQIQVFRNERLRLSPDTVTWDSGEVPGGDPCDVPYAGPPLRRGGRYWWRVRVAVEFAGHVRGRA